MRFRFLLSLLVTLPAALTLSPAAAQQAGASAQPDLVPVMVGTFVAVLIAMFVLSLGYLYRRTRGAQDEVIPKYVEPEAGTEEAAAHDLAGAHGGH
jgi:hypothetical protein